MTMGTNIILGSFTFTVHTPVPDYLLFWEDREVRIRRTGDIENRGSFRCGFYFGFYRALHHVSNGPGSHPASVLIEWRARRSPDRSPHRLPRFSPPPRFCPTPGKPLLPA